MERDIRDREAVARDKLRLAKDLVCGSPINLLSAVDAACGPCCLRTRRGDNEVEAVAK